MRSIKSLRFYILFLFIVTSLLIIGCQKDFQTPTKVNVFQYTQLDVAMESNSTELDLNQSPLVLLQNDATTVRSFLLLRALISKLEEATYLDRLAIDSDQDQDDQALNKPSDTPLTAKQSLPLNNTLVFTAKADKAKFPSTAYTLIMNFADHTLCVENSTEAIKLDKTYFNQLLMSGLIQPNISDNELPHINLTMNNQPLSASQTGKWYTHLYDERFDYTNLYADLKTETAALSGNHLKEEASLQFDWGNIPPASCTVEIYSKDSLLSPLDSFNLDLTSEKMDVLPLPNLNGEYRVIVTAAWPKNTNQSYGEMLTTFNLTVELPKTLRLIGSEFEPGDLVVLEGEHLGEVDNYIVESNIYHEGLNFITSGDRYYLFAPLISKTAPGTYYIKVTDKENSNNNRSFDIQVIEKVFEIQYLETSATTADLKSDENNEQMLKAFNRGRENPHREKIWTGPFIQPVGGRISTEYGEIRYTNGSITDTRHSGIDFANPIGTSVVATQNGYVTLAEDLAITGKTLFIDHGLGIYSQYYHMDYLDVAVGDYVAAGDFVGRVGTTGYSTGPHLHFCIYNKGVYLNPWKLFESAPF